MLRLFDQGKLLPEQAVIAIGIAYLSNLVFKFGLIVTIGGKTLARNCAPAFAITAGGLIVALLAQSLVNG